MVDVHKQTLVQRAQECWNNGRIGRSFEGLTQARLLLAEAQKVGDEQAIAECHRCIGWFCLQLGYPNEGLKAADAARNYYAQVDNDWGHALSLAVYSWLVLDIGLSDICFETSSQAVVIASRTQDHALNAFALNCKALALVMCKELHLGEQMLAEAVVLAERSGDGSTIALTHCNQSYVRLSRAMQLQEQGEREQAQQVFDEAMAVTRKAAQIARSHGDLWNLWTILCNGAEGLASFGQVDVALRYLAEVEALPCRPGPRSIGHFLFTKGDAYRHLNRGEEALAVYQEAERLASLYALSDQLVQALHRLSEIRADRGEYEDALRAHRAYHASYVRQTDEVTRQRALVVDMQLTNEQLRKRTEELEIQAGIDALTGIPNRRAFDAAFASVGSETGSVGILDVDHFKQVNDQYSHAVGDKVLSRVAKAISSIDPNVDVYRIGGEEFGLIFPGLALEVAAPLAWRMVELLRTIDFSDLAKGLRVTASVGLAEAGLLHGSALLAEADRRLYVAKRGGRDQVIADGRSSVSAIPAE